MYLASASHSSEEIGFVDPRYLVDKVTTLIAGNRYDDV